MNIKRSILLIMCLFCSTVFAQEFRCGVSVNYQKLQSTTQQYETGDNKIFETMKRSIEEFVNNRHWTNLEMENQERIDCSINIILTQRTSATDFTGQISIQLRRPIYNSNYTSGLFNYLEGNNDLVFSFNESQPLEFDPNTFYDNLSSTLAYYCYIMLGIYFDSYGPNGGEPFSRWPATLPKWQVPQPDTKDGTPATARKHATGLWKTTPTRHTRLCIAYTTTTTALVST